MKMLLFWKHRLLDVAWHANVIIPRVNLIVRVCSNGRMDVMGVYICITDLLHIRGYKRNPCSCSSSSFTSSSNCVWVCVCVSGATNQPIIAQRWRSKWCSTGKPHLPFTRSFLLADWVFHFHHLPSCCCSEIYDERVVTKWVGILKWINVRTKKKQLHNLNIVFSCFLFRFYFPPISEQYIRLKWKRERMAQAYRDARDTTK